MRVLQGVSPEQNFAVHADFCFAPKFRLGLDNFRFFSRNFTTSKGHLLKGSYMNLYLHYWVKKTTKLLLKDKSRQETVSISVGQMPWLRARNVKNYFSTV